MRGGWGGLCEGVVRLLRCRVVALEAMLALLVLPFLLVLHLRPRPPVSLPKEPPHYHAYDASNDRNPTTQKPNNSTTASTTSITCGLLA